ncbi:MAG: Na/Pi cotransporter [Bdellovibrionales bacterium CG12_big_fil_rev_8_21_14_0_65_38_15]|nr:MAG: Na/Pi cotransporter [Bdellovibrionales bacterium CG22_combo_CG10-13_8_21_14_all_38_13]PIQ52946.1 MAG: Na/Pi cotransporter [Bdellovibrionales bacterium CG12_big_fil_rev_8_21_14_0_65_38_15]PIR28674.1 MAG: Na/Pi cotransporter [Bdellovibrionales bacterium CG11_big_fil_rev_8_21_14_0_20_38_13]
MTAFNIIYTMLGGLGLFFFGMKLMSDALQSAASDVIKNIINTITKHRVYSITVGVIVTMIVQSSSITTVMVVGFVNAGLMNLTQAIGIIFGANIGTTITGWIISIKIGKYGLLLIGAGFFPMLFADRGKWKTIGQVLFGVGLVFYGLDIMSAAFKPLRGMPEFLDAISFFSGQSYGAYIASIMMGCILTMVVQSSSAMLGITMALATTGVIEFHTAAALVLGENVGTTITALLASVGGNINAKRAARAHAIFNILGVAVVFSIFPWFVELIDSLVAGDPNMINAAGEKPNIAVHIATGHTLFNVTATIVFTPFLHQLARLVTWMTPEREKEQHHLVMLGDLEDMVPATALAMAQAEIEKMQDIVGRMFKISDELLKGESSEGDDKRIAKIKDYERITDSIQKEITVFVCKMMEKSLSPKQSVQAQAIVREADELESVADYLERVAGYLERTPKATVLKDKSRMELLSLFDEVREFYDLVVHRISQPSKLDIDLVQRKADAVVDQADRLRTIYLERVASGEFDALSALTYSDMVVALRKVKSHSFNIFESLVRLKGLD